MENQALAPPPDSAALFRAFLGVGLRGFGGVLPWARRMLVEERRWLDDRGFTEVLSLGQLMPGPNVVNMSIVIGSRFAGVRGAIAAFGGLMAAPIVIVLLLAEAYRHFGGIEIVQHMLSGVSAAAAGLVLATGARLAQKLERRAWMIALTAVTFVAVAWLHLPLLAVLVVIAPLGIACGWHSVQKENR
jgi:chromate transporter